MSEREEAQENVSALVKGTSEIFRHIDNTKTGSAKYYAMAHEALKLSDASRQATLREVGEILKNYGISITNEGILVPYNDEWDSLYDTPRRMLLRGNDKGESARLLFESLKSDKPPDKLDKIYKNNPPPNF